MASTATTKQLDRADYHVAWICPLADIELLPARLMLDEEHLIPTYNTHYDENTYICGAINGHNVVVATCPRGETGNVNAGRLTGSMFKTFPNIRLAVLVGIGGGIPLSIPAEDALDDVHLGDVVVGWPGDGKPACVYHDRGRSKVGGHFEMVGTMQNPEWRLTNALSVLASDHELGLTKFDHQLARLQGHKKFRHPGLKRDRLFKATYHHIGGYGSNCLACDGDELVQRAQRSESDKYKLVFHQGRIATGTSVIQDGELRDQISARCDGALCVEMEAAGVDVNRTCLVVRGISDYADSHKDDAWKSFAAGNAAAFTRELLCRIQPAVVKDMKAVTEAPWTVPFARPPSFAGRETQLAQLQAHILLEGGQRLAIYGLGGCGKTALALESSYRTREQQPGRAIFWVPAMSQESFEQAYHELATLLHIPGTADASADVKRLVKAWLSDEGFGPWLMVVDNADDVSVLLGPPKKRSSGTRLIDFLPHSSKGSVLFTTRTREAAVDLACGSAIRLEELVDKEAVKILKTRLLPERQHLLQDHQAVHIFVDMLAFLALAIIQAVAFVNKNNCTLSEYISMYRDSEEDAIVLLCKDFEDYGRYRNMKNPVVTTWYISFQHIQQQNPLAADYLSFMTCTTGDNIPEALLPPGSSRLETLEAYSALDAYAFVTIRRQSHERGENQQCDKIFDMHRLVRLASQNWLKEHQQWDTWAKKAMKRLLEVLPYANHHNKEVWTAYLPHAIYIVDLPEICETEGRIWLLRAIGHCEYRLGRYKAAEAVYREVLEKTEVVVGKEHPRTLMTMQNMANTLGEQGKYVEAEKIYQVIIALSRNVLGKEHVDTLVAMMNMASTLTGQGKYAEAEKIYRETTALQEKTLGEKHPTTLTGRHCLALTISSQGRFIEAETIYHRVLAQSEDVLGKEHPDTLRSRHSLAVTTGRLGKYTEAEKMHQETFALSEKLLGKDHPDTLAIRSSLAEAIQCQGKYTEAEKMHQETLALQAKILGKEHPDTLVSRYSLAEIMRCQGMYIEAENMHQETLALREKTLGEDHPYTLMSRHQLAKTISSQGKYIEAEKMHQETLVLREKTLRKDHPDTLRTRHNLAETIRCQGTNIEAEKMHQKTLALRRKH